MPWCPVCKSEYREGFTTCGECKVDLVPEEPKEKEETLDYSSVVDLGEFELEEETDENSAENSEEWEYSEEENEDNKNKEMELLQLYSGMKKMHQMGPSTVYENRGDKAKEYKSSAYVLVLVGLFGILLLTLIQLQIIPIHFGNEIMINIVMGGMFVIFIVMGVASFRSSKQLAEEALEENILVSEVNQWCEKNLNSKEIDLKIGDAELVNRMPHELLYFKRSEYMRKLITEKFLNLEETFLETIIEKYYQLLFENEK